jgi:hypothetical protein
MREGEINVYLLLFIYLFQMLKNRKNWLYASVMLGSVVEIIEKPLK